MSSQHWRNGQDSLPAASERAAASLRIGPMAVSAVLLVYLLWEVRGTTLLVQWGRFNLHTIDICVAFCCAMMPFASAPKINSAAKLSLSIFIGIFFIAILRTAYLPDFVVRVATLRANALFIVLILSTLLQRPSEEDTNTYYKIFGYFGVLLCSLEILRFIFGPMFLTDRAHIGAIFYNTGRPLGAFSALILAICAVWRLLITFRADQAHDVNRNILKYFGFSLFVVLSGQRTVMIDWALASALAIALALPRLWKVSPAFTLVLSVVCIATAVASFSDTFWNTVLHFQYSSSRADTFSTRTEIWRSLLNVSQDWSFVDKAFGAPVGAELNIRVSGVQRYWENGMHSAYFGPIPFSGYLGAISLTSAVVIGLFAALTALVRGVKENEFGLTPDEVIVLDVLFLIFGISYDWLGFIGVCLVLIAGKWPSPAARRTRMPLAATSIPAP